MKCVKTPGDGSPEIPTDTDKGFRVCALHYAPADLIGGQPGADALCSIFPVIKVSILRTFILWTDAFFLPGVNFIKITSVSC